MLMAERAFGGYWGRRYESAVITLFFPFEESLGLV